MNDAPTPRTDAALLKASQFLDPRLALIEMTGCCNQLEHELASALKDKECWIFNANELQKAYNGLNAKVAAELARPIPTHWTEVPYVRELGERAERLESELFDALKRAEQAEAKLNIAREVLHVIHCDIAALKPEWVSQQPDGFKMVAANIEKLAREALDKIK